MTVMDRISSSSCCSSGSGDLPGFQYAISDDSMGLFLLADYEKKCLCGPPEISIPIKVEHVPRLVTVRSLVSCLLSLQTLIVVSTISKWSTYTATWTGNLPRRLKRQSKSFNPGKETAGNGIWKVFVPQLRRLRITVEGLDQQGNIITGRLNSV